MLLDGGQVDCLVFRAQVVSVDRDREHGQGQQQERVGAQSCRSHFEASAAC